jgi:hypothetical protein
MDAKEFKNQAMCNGYAYAPTINDYMELYDEPYTQEDLISVDRWQAYRDAWDMHAVSQGELHVKEDGMI